MESHDVNFKESEPPIFQAEDWWTKVHPIAKFLVPVWGISRLWHMMDVPACQVTYYTVWRAGTTTLCKSRLRIWLQVNGYLNIFQVF
jgi:hypothetical protein